MTVKLNTAAATETAITLLLVMTALLVTELAEVLLVTKVLVVIEPVSSPMMLLPLGSARGDGQ
jgi:hypothetical protein|tara:strand:- start:181 stop:369 length:189 start_codon:yes stop_codon:yes gene_type:complete